MAPADPRHPGDEALALLAVGALPGDESAAVEEHLAGCASCRRRFAERLAEVAALVESVEPAEPPAGAREALVARLAESGGPAAAVSPPPARRRGRAGRVALRLAASFLLGALAGALLARRAADDELAAAARRQAAAEAESSREIGRLRGELAAARAALALTPAPEAVRLAGLAAAPEAQGRVFVDRAGGRALFVARGLPPLPAGRTYQLWRIVDGRPLPAGLLAAEEGTVIVEPVGAGAGEVWAVTVEPAGGVPSPTGEMVLSS